MISDSEAPEPAAAPAAAPSAEPHSGSGLPAWLTGDTAKNVAICVGGAAALYLLWRRKPNPTLPGAIATNELKRWPVGVNELTSEGERIVQEYWTGAGLPYPGSSEVPWSAAFVSWCVAKSSIPGSLPPAATHLEYAVAAYGARGVQGRYGAFRPEEIGPLRPGDIVLKSRDNSGARFEDLISSPGFRAAHGDFVVAATAGGYGLVGGNVNQRVESHWMVLDYLNAAPSIFAVLRLQ